MDDSPVDCPSGKRWFRHEHDVQGRALADEIEYGWLMRYYLCPCGWWHKARKRKDGLPILSLDWLQKKRRSEARPSLLQPQPSESRNP